MGNKPQIREQRHVYDQGPLPCELSRSSIQEALKASKTQTYLRLKADHHVGVGWRVVFNSMKTCAVLVKNTIMKLSRKDHGNEKQKGQCILTGFVLMT